MEGKILGIISGAFLLLVGLILAASAYVSSALYGWTVNTVFYSPWLDWGLVILGAVIMFVFVVASFLDR